MRKFNPFNFLSISRLLLLVTAFSSCKKVEFKEKTVLWNAEMNLSGSIEVYCDSVLTSVDTLPDSGHVGDLLFYKDGTGENNSISLVEGPNFTWHASGDTLIISAGSPMNLTFILKNTLSPSEKHYKPLQFIGEGAPCWQNFTGPNSYLKLEF